MARAPFQTDRVAAAQISAFVAEQSALVGAFYVWRRDRGWVLLA